MRRQLTKVEKAYIDQNHATMSVDELCGDMQGVGPKTVQAYIDDEVLPKKQNTENMDEYHSQIQKRTGLQAGNLMGRDPSRGIAVMTEAASTVSDAHRGKNTKTAATSKDRIFVMDPSKPTR
jgi:hypothetical protein